jgi:hypothetical protein
MQPGNGKYETALFNSRLQPTRIEKFFVARRTPFQSLLQA